MCTSIPYHAVNSLNTSVILTKLLLRIIFKTHIKIQEDMKTWEKLQVNLNPPCFREFDDIKKKLLRGCNSHDSWNNRYWLKFS